MSFASRVRRALPLGVQPMARYHYEKWRGLLERELPLFCEMVRPGDRVVDVGANYGIYVHALRRRGAIVEAFEPQPVCAQVLRAYAESDSAVRVYEVALGRAEGAAELEIPIVGGKAARGSASLVDWTRRHPEEQSDEGSLSPTAVNGLAVDSDPSVAPLLQDDQRVRSEKVAVRVRPLDSFGFTDIRAMKIDVEGAELDVIGGATETLARCRPTLLVEVEQRHHTDPISRVFETMTSLGYEASFLLPGTGWRPVTEFRPGVYQRLESFESNNGLYINNFLFRPTA